MDGMQGPGAGARFLDWTCELGTQEEGEKQIWVEEMSSASDLRRRIKVTLGQPKDISSGQWRGHLGLRRGSGQGELSAQRQSLRGVGGS